jgi:hypothetical protein
MRIFLSRRLGVAAFVVVAMLILSVDAFVLVARRPATPVALDEVVQSFRRGTATTATSAPTVTNTAAAPPGADTTATTSTAHARTAPDSRPGASSPPTAPASAAVGLPQEGVYAYDTTGSETVSLGGARHDYPPVTYGTVRRTSGCEWTFERVIVKEHSDRTLFCSRPDVLLFLSQLTKVTFFGQTVSDEVKCDPPQRVVQAGDAAGSSREYVCHSPTYELRARVTRVGRERIVVGGQTVEAERIRVDATISGDANGTSVAEQWWLPSSSVLARETRSSESRAHEFGATIDYRERATFHLRSLNPQT